jgi:hypothetical protein
MSMTIESPVCVLNPHALLVQAAQLQRPEVHVPDPVVDTRNSGHEQNSVAFPIRNSALVGQEEMIFVQDIIEGQEER